MADLKSALAGIGTALTGTAMGIQGRGAEFAQSLEAQRQAETDRQNQAAQTMLKNRAIINRVTLDSIEAGNPQQAFNVISDVISSGELQGKDKEDALSLATALRLGIEGDKSQFKNIIDTLTPMDKENVLRGFVPERAAPKEEEALSKAVQSSEILPDGTAIAVLKNSQTVVRDAEGNELTGKARANAIKKAREFGAYAQGDRAAQRELGKLQSQFKLAPKVKSAVEASVLAARQNAARFEDERSNEKAMSVYEAATEGLLTALEQTTTGPGAGFIPAITANQQIADGAVAAMAPTLKQLFRSAGEGNFTDADQALLMQMVPTRKDSREAALAKMANIDTIVRAKLATQKPPTTPADSPAEVGTPPADFSGTSDDDLLRF